MWWLLVCVVIGGFYTAWNIGANDVANAVGPSVGAGVLTLRQAVLIAAVFEFLGAVVLGDRVIGTIESGLVAPADHVLSSQDYVFGMTAALFATGVWLQIASFFGWPVSTTHAIVGGVLGFGIILKEDAVIYWDSCARIFVSWLASPIIGGYFAFLIFSFIRKAILYKRDPVSAMVRIAPFLSAIIIFALGLILILSGAVARVVAFPVAFRVVCGLVVVAFAFTIWGVHFFKLAVLPQKVGPGTLLDRLLSKSTDYGRQYLVVERIFAYLQIVIACFMSFAHGSNDVANAIAPVAGIYRALYPQSYSPKVLFIFMSLGGLGLVFGLATWGWRVIDTIGKKITELTPSRGFSVGMSSAITIAAASAFGFPISTTHVVVGAVLGVGLARGLQAINLRIIKDIVLSWFITVPAGAALSIIFFLLLRAVFC
jgi:Phosphate/sulphate permeases